jgi:hypothetical protein
MWSNSRDPPSWSKIDRLLISPVFFNYLRRGCLELAPFFLIVKAFTVVEGIFENMWLKSEGFVDKVKQWWTSYQFQGSPSFILAHKLKALKANLRV